MTVEHLVGSSPAGTYKGCDCGHSTPSGLHVIGSSPAEMHPPRTRSVAGRRWRPNCRATLRGVIEATTLRLERVGLAALQVLNVSRDLVRRKEHAALWPHVEAMSRIPKFNRRRKTKSAEPAIPPKPVISA
jgi:hypothetical protein